MGRLENNNNKITFVGKKKNKTKYLDQHFD